MIRLTSALILGVFMLSCSSFVVAEPTIQAFAELRLKYAVDEEVQFTVKNVSKNQLFYWVELQRQFDGEWSRVYVSIKDLRGTKSEPAFSRINAGEMQVVRWRPAADKNFLIQFQSVDIREYKFVLHSMENPSELSTIRHQDSKSFELNSSVK